METQETQVDIKKRNAVLTGFFLIPLINTILWNYISSTTLQETYPNIIGGLYIIWYSLFSLFFLLALLTLIWFQNNTKWQNTIVNLWFVTLASLIVIDIWFFTMYFFF